VVVDLDGEPGAGGHVDGLVGQRPLLLRQVRDLDGGCARARVPEAEPLVEARPGVAFSEEPAGGLRRRADEAEQKLPRVREAKAKRELELEVGRRKAATNVAASRLEKALDELDRLEVVEPRVKAARSERAGLQSALDDANGALKGSADWELFAFQVKKQLAEAEPRLRRGEQALSFAQGPGDSLNRAVEAVADANAATDLEGRLKKQLEAGKAFQACVDDGRAILAKAPEIQKVPVLVRELKTSPQAVIDACAAGAKSSEKRVAGLRKKLSAAKAAK